MSVATLPGLEIVRAVPTVVRTLRADPAADAADDQAVAAMPTMEVRFSPFGTWYEINSWWEGRFLERTVKGAFKKTISENGQNVRCLYDHGYDYQIGNKVLGAIDDLREDSDSAVGVVPLFDTHYCRELLPGLEAGVYGSSFRFRVIQESWNEEPGKSEYNPDALPERTITEVRLFEFGPVTFPANPDATAGVRSLTDSFYERLAARDPQRVDELRSRMSTIRTPDDAAAARTGTGAAGAATTTDEPAPRHSGGLTHAQRRVRLHPYLQKTGAPS
jgi:HK97 family phage prohead protease